jgi:hypothetical protein
VYGTALCGEFIDGHFRALTGYRSRKRFQ